jgi:hypothetical protein
VDRSGFGVRVAYKVFPLSNPNPIFPGRTFTWTPLLNVNVMYNHVKSARFEAVVDSGSPWCLFHADVGVNVGIDISTGVEEPLGGVIGGAIGKVYFHSVKLCLPGTIIDIMAGFSPQLSVAGILGRAGFFDNYIVTFDPCNKPPGLDIQRVGRA